MITKEQFLDFCGDNRPTEEQQKAIFEDYSVVAAGAGSGKTATLSQRFLWLVMNGIPADKILTITFTKDAASSMKGKIFKTLQEAVNQKLITKEDLFPFSQATICTTDSFCSEIAKMGCVKYGIPATFQIEDSSELEIISSQIVDKVLEDNKGPRLDDYLSFYSIENIKETMLELANKYINIATPIDTKSIKSFILNYYSQNKKTEYIKEIIKQLNQYKENAKLKKEQLVAIEEFFDKYASNIETALDEIKKKLSIPKNPSKKEPEEGSKAYYKHKIREEIQPLEILILATKEENLQRLEFICKLINDYQEELIKHKRETGLITFHDVMKMAIDILMNNESVRTFYNEKFMAIMVDEFQDNNEDNKNLIYLLATTEAYQKGKIPDKNVIDKKKIFMVGDEKQSIYKFRNADVSVFKGISNDGLSVCKLTQNFRSEKEIIGTVNCLFKKIMEEAEKSYEAKFQELTSKNSHVTPQISFQYLIEQETVPDGCLSAAESEAYEVARKIKEIVTTNRKAYQVYKNKKQVDPDYSDIAILLKVGTHQANYEKALRYYNIPIDSSESKTLTMDAVLNDIYTVLQLAVYGPSDEVSKYAYLKGPFCKLTDEQIFENKKDVYDQNKELIDDLRSYISNHSLSKVVSYIWNELGYRFYITSKEDNQPFEEHYDYVFKLACNFDDNNKTLVDFLNYLRPMIGKESSIKDLSIQKEESSGVKIMTIHKSKGLEFPIVIIPDMHSGSSSPGGFNPKIRLAKLKETKTLTLPYCPSEENKLVNPLEEDAQDDKRMENAETKRVFYVAATRAQYHLIFSGVIPKIPTEEKDNTKYINLDEDKSHSQLDYFLHSIDFKYETPPKETIIPDKVVMHPEVKIKMEPFNYQSINELKQKEVNDTNLTDIFKESESNEIEFEKQVIAVTKDDGKKNDGPVTKELEIDNAIKDRETEFGELVHKLIENEINKNPNVVSGYFEDHEEKDKIYSCAKSLKDQFISSKFFKDLKADYQLFAEEPIMVNDNGQLKNGIIDLLCIKDDEIVIVDYKTDRFFDPKKHEDQLRVYTLAAKYIYNRHVKTYLYYLRSCKAELLF